MQSVNEIALILNEGIKTIGVKFIDQFGESNGREYTYLTKYDHEVGSHVVVEANNRLAVVRVTRVDGDLPQIDDKHQYRFIIQKIDNSEYLKNQSDYLSLTENVKRLMLKSKRDALRREILSGNEELAKLCHGFLTTKIEGK